MCRIKTVPGNRNSVLQNRMYRSGKNKKELLLNEADSTQRYYMGLNRSTAVPLTKYSGECAIKMQK
jgi:hypothetical protein